MCMEYGKKRKIQSDNEDRDNKKHLQKKDKQRKIVDNFGHFPNTITEVLVSKSHPTT